MDEDRVRKQLRQAKRLFTAIVVSFGLVIVAFVADLPADRNMKGIVVVTLLLLCYVCEFLLAIALVRLSSAMEDSKSSTLLALLYILMFWFIPLALFVMYFLTTRRAKRMLEESASLAARNAAFARLSS